MAWLAGREAWLGLLAAGWLVGLGWAGLGWAGLGWAGLGCGLGWAGLGWLGWAGLGWAGLLGWKLKFFENGNVVSGPLDWLGGLGGLAGGRAGACKAG